MPNLSTIINPPGSVLRTLMLSAGEISQAASTLIPNDTFTTIATYNYTPLSNRSFIIIEYDTVYRVPGSSADTIHSNIEVNGTEISYAEQRWLGIAAYGQGTRGGTIFPIMGRYLNSSLTAKTITIRARRVISDDTTEVIGDKSTWLKITETMR